MSWGETGSAGRRTGTWARRAPHRREDSLLPAIDFKNRLGFPADGHAEGCHSPMILNHLEIPTEQIADFCRRNHIRRLALFGSILRDDFTPESDVDVLVEFEPGKTPGLLGMAGLEIELSEMFDRKVDLRTKEDLSRYFRDEVAASAVVQYDSEA